MFDHTAPNGDTPTPKVLLTRANGDFIQWMKDDDAVAEAQREGVAFEYGPDTPELRQRNSAILADHQERKDRERKERWREIRAPSNATENKKLARYAKGAIAKIINDIEDIGPGDDWATPLYHKAGKLAGWAEYGFISESDAKAALLTAAKPWNGYEEGRAKIHINNGWNKPITPTPPTDIYREGIRAEGRHKSATVADADSPSQTTQSVSETGQVAANPADDDSGESDPHEDLVQTRMMSFRATREANRRLDAEERPPLLLPAIKSLDTLLAEPDTPTRYRIDQLAPEGGRVLLSAQYKAGKTTVIGNLLRSLADGDPFLGMFAVNIAARHVVLIDTEMSENTMRRWLRDQGVGRPDAVDDVITLRGRVSTFNLLDKSCREVWAARLRELGCDYLILDCLRPVLDALGLDENRDAGRFLVEFDALLAEAGIPDALIVHHMGHTNERARGDSRLQDWPDAIWRIVRETEEPDSTRYFSAHGRDVDVHEGRLSFDPSGRRLTYCAGSRLDAKAEAAQNDIIGLLARSEHGLSGNAIENDPALADHARKPIRAGLKRAIEDGFVTVEDGPRRSKLHRINYPCEHCGMPVAGGGKRHQSCPK